MHGCAASYAAIGIIGRQGLGKVRHLDLSYLWLQAAVQGKQVILRKVQSGDNMADIGTKVLDRDIFESHASRRLRNKDDPIAQDGPFAFLFNEHGEVNQGLKSPDRADRSASLVVPRRHCALRLKHSDGDGEVDLEQVEDQLDRNKTWLCYQKECWAETQEMAPWCDMDQTRHAKLHQEYCQDVQCAWNQAGNPTTRRAKPAVSCWSFSARNIRGSRSFSDSGRENQ